MSIPVIAAEHTEGGYSTDYGIVQMRQGMKMAFPDDNIAIADGEGDGSMSAESVDDMSNEAFDASGLDDLQEVQMLGNECATYSKRGISRTDLPAIKALLGDKFPKALPDEFYSVTPSKNGWDLVQEGFLSKVGEMLKKATLAMWEFMKVCYSFIADAVSNAWKRIFGNRIRARKFIETSRDIMDDVRKMMSDEDYALFLAEVGEELNVNNVYETLQGRRKQLDVQVTIDNRLIMQRDRLSKLAADGARKLLSINTQFKEIMGWRVSSISNDREGKSYEKQCDYVLQELDRLFSKLIDDIARADLPVKRGDLKGTLTALLDWKKRNQRDEGHRRDLSKADWVESFKKAQDIAINISEGDEYEYRKMLQDEIASKLADVVKTMPVKETVDKTTDSESDKTAVVMGELQAAAGILDILSRIVTDFELQRADMLQMRAKFHDLELKASVTALSKNPSWKGVKDQIVSRIQRELGRTGIGKIIQEPVDKKYNESNWMDVGTSELKKQFDKFVFEDAVTKGLFVENGVNLVAVHDDIRQDLERVSSLLPTEQSDADIEVDEATQGFYAEMRRKYLPEGEDDLSQEGFGLLKMGLIGALFVAAYKLIERIIRWIKETLAERKRNRDVVQQKVQQATETEAAINNLTTPTDEMVRDLEKHKPNAAMLKAAGLDASNGQGSSNLDDTAVGISLADKQRVIAGALEGIREELMRSSSWHQLESALTSVSLGYFQDSQLETIVREIRHQVPDRVAYLSTQCDLINSALIEQRNQSDGEVGPLLSRLFTTLEKGRLSYTELYNARKVFTYNGKTASAHLPQFDFSPFAADIFKSAKPVYPSDEVIGQVRQALKDNSFLVFNDSSDEISSLALKRYNDLDNQFKKLRDLAQQVKAVPGNVVNELQTTIGYVQAQITEVASYYSFEEGLRDNVVALIDAMNAVQSLHLKTAQKRLAEYGLKDWGSKS